LTHPDKNGREAMASRPLDSAQVELEVDAQAEFSPSIE
jgi:hypothetical protein